MIHSNSLLSLVLLPTLAIAAPSHGHQHAHRLFAKRALVTSTSITYVEATMTVTVYGSASTSAVVTFSNPDITPAKSIGASAEVEAVDLSLEQKQPTSKAESSSSFIQSIETSSSSVQSVESSSVAAQSVPTPASKPSKDTTAVAAGGSVLLKNACPYDVTFDLIRTLASCGSDIHDKVVKAGDTWTSELKPCEDANPSLKVFRVDDIKKTNPFQFEFGFKPSQSMAWYNLSPKDCVSDMYGAGMDSCAGGPWSISATSSAALAQNEGQCRTFQCSDPETCCLGEAYCDAWATAARAIGGEEPVAGCPGTVDQLNIVMQLC